MEENCLLWGVRMIVPLKLRHHVLDELHLSHLGIVRMKSLARIHVWWPNIDKDIEAIVRTCNAFQAVQAKPPQAPTHSWTWPKVPWEHIHVDLLAHLWDTCFSHLLTHTRKWLEGEIMSSTTSERTLIG